MYPVGIPLLYAYILWTNRDSLNPRVQTDANADESSGPTFSFLAKGDPLTKESMEELNEKLEKRMQNPNLVPSMFLWKDFGEKSLVAGLLFYIARQSHLSYPRKWGALVSLQVSPC